MTNSTCRVSVIIPCYNSEQFLAETLDSLVAQTYPAAEIIVVDDGSKDQTRQVATRYNQVTYIYQANQGAAVARNTGIQASRGDYLVFLDGDDRLLPQALEIGLQGFAASPDCGFTYGTCHRIDQAGVPIPSDFPVEAPVEGVPVEDVPPTPAYEILLGGMSLHPPARFMFRRELVNQISGFDPSLRSADDYDFYIRAAAAAPGYGHGQPVVEYRVHPTSITNRTRSAQHFAEALAIFRKQEAFVQAHPVYQPIHTQGLDHWINIYGPYLAYDSVFWLKRGKLGPSAQALSLALRYYPQGFVNYGQELATKLGHKLSP